MTLATSLSRRARASHPQVKAGWLLALLSVGFSPMAAAQLELEQLWVRAMPPTQSMTAAYGQLSNQGDTPLTITGASSSLAAGTTLHESVQTGDRIKMVPVAEVTLAPGEVLELKPAGLHLMLTGINAMPAAGSEVEICLVSAEDKTCATAIVQRDADGMNHHHH